MEHVTRKKPTACTLVVLYYHTNMENPKPVQVPPGEQPPTPKKVSFEEPAKTKTFEEERTYPAKEHFAEKRVDISESQKQRQPSVEKLEKLEPREGEILITNENEFDFDAKGN